MKFSATVKNIIFENESNGFRIFSVDKDGEERIIKGNSFKVMPGDFLDIEANKVQDPKYGEQYNIIFVERSSKPSMYNIINYLQSGLIKGIGETTARRIVEEFGEDTMEILKNSPSKLFQNFKKIKDKPKTDYAKSLYYFNLAIAYVEDHQFQKAREVLQKSTFQKYNQSFNQIFKMLLQDIDKHEKEYNETKKTPEN